MTTASTIARFEQLPAVDGVVNALLKLLNRDEDGDTDVMSAVHYMKAVIDGYINDLEGDNRKCIEGGKDVFYIWVYHKVIMYRYKTSAEATGEDEEEMAVEYKKCPELEGKEIKKHDDVAKRKNQFSQHMDDLEVVINQANFTAASLAFTNKYVPICGQTFLKMRDRVRDGRGREKTASYYCPCGKKDNLFFQLRHDDVTDVRMVNNEKRYVFRCFTKPGHAKLVAQHFHRRNRTDDKPEAVYNDKTQTYASGTGIVAEGIDIVTQDGKRRMQGENEFSRRTPGDKEREAYDNLQRKEGGKMRKKDIGVLTTGHKVISEMKNNINKRGRAENNSATFRGKKFNVDNVSANTKFSNYECKEQIYVGTSTATKTTEVKSDSDEDDHETTEAFIRFRTQLSMSQKRERKVTEM